MTTVYPFSKTGTYFSSQPIFKPFGNYVVGFGKSFQKFKFPKVYKITDFVIGVVQGRGLIFTVLGFTFFFEYESDVDGRCGMAHIGELNVTDFMREVK